MAVAVASLVLVVVVSVGSGLTSQRVRDAGDYLTSMSKSLKPPIKLIGDVLVVVVDHFRGGCIFCFFSRGGAEIIVEFHSSKLCPFKSAVSISFQTMSRAKPTKCMTFGA